jgi:flagellar basal-body rod modification protein FlgD
MAISPVTGSPGLDVTNGVPTAEQLANKRTVTADVEGDQIKTSSVQDADRMKVFDKNGKNLGKQDFLNLLVTQLRFQDPMSPTENTEFVAQLAQFSNLEGTNNINTAIEDLGKQIASLVGNQKASSDAISNSSATSMIGKTVRVTADDVIYDPNDAEPIKINVHSDAGKASVLSVLDSEGTIVNAVPIPSPGENLLEWNGTKLNGSKAPGGKYTLKVTTLDGKTDTGYAYLQDRVTGINYSKDGMKIEVRGQSIAMDKIVHVGEAEENGE